MTGFADLPGFPGLIARPLFKFERASARRRHHFQVYRKTRPKESQPTELHTRARIPALQAPIESFAGSYRKQRPWHCSGVRQEGKLGSNPLQRLAHKGSQQSPICHQLTDSKGLNQQSGEQNNGMAIAPPIVFLQTSFVTVAERP
jgi:hypothetical protein